MTCTRFAEGQVLFKEGDPTDSVFRLLRGAVNIIRELDGEPVQDMQPHQRDVAMAVKNAREMALLPYSTR